MDEQVASSLDAEKWTAVSLTHVEYIKGDIIGLFLALCSLLPVFVMIGIGTLILFRRDLHTISYCLGLVLNEMFNLVLKHIIQEHRPLRSREVVFTEYGMPSSHAQFSWFFATYLVLFLFIRVHHNYNTLENLWKYLTCLIVFIMSFIVCCSRIYLGYHTFRQVMVGSLIGILLGPLWFCAVQLVFTPFFPVIASWPLSEFLMIRDSTLIPNVMWFEYTSSRSEARSRQRKLVSRKSQ